MNVSMPLSKSPLSKSSPLKALCAAGASLVLAGTVAPSIAADGVSVTAFAASEAAYQESLRERLENGMRAASRTEDAASRDGTVAMWFVLSRDGQLISRGLEQSSGSAALDREARRIVSHAHYAAMPDGTWNRGADRRYVATMHFGLDGVDDRAALDLR